MCKSPILALAGLVFLGCHPKMPLASVHADARGLDDSTFIFSCIESLDTAHLPRFWVKLNFHFIETGSGNFYAGSDDDWSYTNGITWAKRMVNHVNSDMRQMKPNPVFKENFVGDARYQFVLYSDPANADDRYGGIWFWENGLPSRLPYGDSVLHVLFYEKGKSGDFQLTGYACGMGQCNYMVLYDAYDCSKQENHFGWWSYAGLMNHEFGHIMGLCHSFYCDNPCKDLPQEAECFTNPCFNDCGGPNNKHCNAWDTGSTNMMGYHKDQNTLSPCQWKQLFRSLFRSKALFVRKVNKGDQAHISY